jgi:hypothetical protein
MASLQKKGEAFYCQFCYLGRRYTVTVGKVSEDEAEAFAGGTDLILLRLKQKLITLRPGVGIEEFVLSGSKTPEQPVPTVEPIAFSAVKQKYLDTHGNGAMEANSLQTVGMHLKHIERTLVGLRRAGAGRRLQLAAFSPGHFRREGEAALRERAQPRPAQRRQVSPPGAFGVGLDVAGPADRQGAEGGQVHRLAVQAAGPAAGLNHQQHDRLTGRLMIVGQARGTGARLRARRTGLRRGGRCGERPGKKR